jgi:hypothetical protein
MAVTRGGCRSRPNSSTPSTNRRACSS